MAFVSKLDSIVEQSLRSFYQDICTDWWGRENEMVNLYACRLAKLVPQGQIGIEVAVRQLPLDDLLKIDRKVPGCCERKRIGAKDVVRKDLVIWPSARMTVWKDNLPMNEPLAIMEWKANHSHNRDRHNKNWRCHRWDVEWLRRTSLRRDMESFIGYAVMVEDTQNPKAVTCTRVQVGAVDKKFLQLPAKAATRTAAGS
ncbi:MAG TPA: hypothetical protein VGR48_19205 [Terriglobales bacterium]|nr:hypothetical protein [Terriglobales bacterium]